MIDLRLSDRRGEEIVRQLRADEATRNVSIALLSTSREECERELIEVPGVNACAVLPLDLEQFSEILRAVGLARLVFSPPSPGAERTAP